MFGDNGVKVSPSASHFGWGLISSAVLCALRHKVRFNGHFNWLDSHFFLSAIYNLFTLYCRSRSVFILSQYDQARLNLLFNSSHDFWKWNKKAKLKTLRKPVNQSFVPPIRAESVLMALTKGWPEPTGPDRSTAQGNNRERKEEQRRHLETRWAQAGTPAALHHSKVSRTAGGICV